jgi:hypothetical protein
MKLEEVGYRGAIAPVYAKELRACSTHLELQRMFDERWPWVTDAGGIAHMLCRRTFFEWKQWLALDAQRAKGQFIKGAQQDYWKEGARKYGSLMIPARLIGISLGAMQFKVEECLFLRRVIDEKKVEVFFADCDRRYDATKVTE